MKKIVKKNQIILTALALMLATAGYLQVTAPKENTEKDSVEVGSYADSSFRVSDGTLIDLYADLEEEGSDDLLNVMAENENAVQNGEQVAAETGGDAETEEDIPGEAIMVSTTIRGDYAINAKLYREQVRAKNKEMLMNLLGDTSLTEEQRQSTVESLLELAAVSEKEQATEMVLEAKGFEDAVVNITGEEVDVIINAESVTDRQIAQIEDIVMRKTGMDAEKIVITAAIQSE